MTHRKLGDSSRLRAFVVKPDPDPPRRHEDAKNHEAFSVSRKILSRLRRVFGLLVVAAAVLLLGACAYLLFKPWAGKIPGFEEVLASYQKTEAVLLDRHGDVVHELRVDRKHRRLDWVSLRDVSPALIRAVLAAEDRKFYEHRGVDWSAFGGSLREWVKQSSLRGASTISMQVASKLKEGLEPRNSRRSLWEKWRQIEEARELEKSWTKPQILEAYLNLVFFRGELQGIAAAARGLFDKSPHGLDECESLLLAALIRSPNAAESQVVRRSAQLADAMDLHLDAAEIARVANGALSGPYRVRPETALAPHVARRLLENSRTKSGPDSVRVASTLDARLQRFASDTLQRHLLSIRAQNVRDGAVLAVENRSGDVLAYVGNAGETASARFVDGIQARRQAGSTLKPFLYALGLESRVLTGASLIEDSPLDIPLQGGVYRPENYDNQFQGPVTARTALASSLNIPAVKVLLLVGVDPFVERLRLLGLRDLRSADFYGPSLALGSADVTLWDLVNAYRSLADGGVWTPLRLRADESPAGPPRRVFAEATAYVVSDILSDRESRSRTFSMESPLSTRFWAAVKTGTSKDMRDNWCVGYSRDYTVGVWTGNFSGESMWNVSGITGAAPVWVEIMNWLHAAGAGSAPKPPAGLVARTVQTASSGARRKEWFLPGTEAATFEIAPALANFRISYPAPGTVVALDPDIPEEEQRLFFASEPRDRSHHFELNGETLGSAGSLLLWQPKQGKYRLLLRDSQGRILDAIEFQVRGGFQH